MLEISQMSVGKLIQIHGPIDCNDDGYDDNSNDVYDNDDNDDDDND